MILLVVGGIYLDDGLLQYRLYTARRALDRWDDQRALAALRRAAGIAPESAEVQFLLARANRRLGRFENVRGHLQKAAEQGYPVEKIRREQVLAQAQIGQMNKAEPYLAELLLNPGGDGREICAAYVSGFFINLRINAAMSVLDAWEADFPDDPEPYFRRAEILHEVRDLASAVESYHRGLKLDPGRTSARGKLAMVLTVMNKPGEAEREYRRCLSEDPENIEYRVGLANCLLELGQPTEAEALFHKVVAAEPDHHRGRLGLAKLSVQTGEPAETIRWAEPLLEKSTEDSEVLLLLAQAHNALGDRDKAGELFEKVESVKQADARLDDLILTALNRPDDAELKFEIGKHLIENGSTAEGARWLRTVLQLDRNHLPTHRALAEYYADSGQSELAEQHRELADELAAGQQNETSRESVDQIRP